MKFGVRNRILAKVTSIKKGDVMALVKLDVEKPCTMASVLTAESVEDLQLVVGDEVELIVKAVHVIPIKS